ncbi:hypothetical protein G6F35_003677 [Rhizopus arrhizus]|nr:hypothetical protein G6F35_003677 [Rhizopus arrhizus]
MRCKSMKKRGPRQGYIELLEQRLAKMEKILLSSETAAAGGNSSQEQQQNEIPENEQRIKRGKTNREEHHQHSSSPTSFSSISSSFPSPPTHALIQQPQSAELNEKTLPPMDVIEHMTDLYFTYLHPFCPLFDEATLRKSIREGKCTDFLLLSLLAACARYSERPDIKKNPPWRGGEVYADAARKLLIKVIDEPSISNVQGITLLTLHEYGCGRGPRSWMYGGMAIRMAMELGLHENIENDNANPTLERLTEQETSRKVFWSIYTIDKFSTAATGRPSTLTEPFCTALLPARVNSNCNSGHYYTESLDGNQYLLLNIGGVRKSQLLGSYIDSSRQEQNSGQKPVLNGFAYFIRASNVLGKVTAFVNKKEKFQTSTHPPYHPDSEISKLDKIIDDLYEDLPIEFKNIPTNYELQINPTHQGSLITLHILHNTLVILLHRPSMVVADTLDSEVVLPELKAFVAKSLAKCMKAN